MRQQNAGGSEGETGQRTQRVLGKKTKKLKTTSRNWIRLDQTTYNSSETSEGTLTGRQVEDRQVEDRQTGVQTAVTNGNRTLDLNMREQNFGNMSA